MQQTCPNCGKVYKTELDRLDDKNIQEQFPNEPSWKREQLISGICSDRCWNQFLGMDTETDDDEEEEPDYEDKQKEEEE